LTAALDEHDASTTMRVPIEPAAATIPTSKAKRGFMSVSASVRTPRSEQARVATATVRCPDERAA
jgi:hypothetical protein